MRWILLLCLAAAASPASAYTFDIDPLHSQATFSIRHLMGRVRGSLEVSGGVIEFFDKRPAKASVDAELDARTIDTGNPERDKHLRSADFLDADEHPVVSFKSLSVAPSGKPGRFKVTGELVLRSARKRVTLDVEYLGTLPDPRGVPRAGFTAKGVLNRKDFGVAWNKKLASGGLLLGNEVAFVLDIQAVRRPDP